MPLPAEKGLKPINEYIFPPLSIQDLMPLPAEKGLKRVTMSDASMRNGGFDAPSSRKRIETRFRLAIYCCATGFDAPSSRKRIETFTLNLLVVPMNGFDAPSSRKRIETRTTRNGNARPRKGFDAPSSRKRIETSANAS